MLSLNFFDFFQNNNVLGFFILLFNIFIYLLIFIYFICFFFFFNLNNIKTLNEIKKFSTNNFVLYSFILALFSFSGMPPLLGFFSKFSIVIFFFMKNHFLLIFIFFFINIFLLFFYIQNIKFLVKKNKNYDNILNNYKEIQFYSNLNFLIFLSFLNFCGLFFIETIFIFIENIVTI